MTQLCEEIVCDPNLHHGEPVIAGTATPVRAIVENWKLGVPLEEIPDHLPHLNLSQVFAALYYYAKNQEAIEACMERNRIPETWSGKRYDFDAKRVVEA